MRVFGKAAILLAAAVGAVAGCSSSPEEPKTSNSGRLRIVATTAMVADLVRHVAGERAEVTGLMGEGVDPHLYKPTRDDIARLAAADVVVYSGITLEGRMVENFEKLATGGKPVFAVTDGIDRKALRQPPDMEGHYDPHLWMDAALWSECVSHVADSLAKIDAPHADEFLRNAEAYRAELALLDDYVKRVIATIPEPQRVLVTSHDAFGYFSRRYGIEVHSPQGISTESEASTKDINDLVDFLVRRKLPAVFVETSTNSKSLDAIIEGAADKTVTVRIGGRLFSDAMGTPGTYEGTYVGMIDHNATTIARALGGEAPERGMNGKLEGTGTGGEGRGGTNAK